jgi:hypothetical protein
VSVRPIYINFICHRECDSIDVYDMLLHFLIGSRLLEVKLVAGEGDDLQPKFLKLSVNFN